ncbi:GNAT family N-acetyltransferase [Pseudonocardia sp. TRM90224]|uniref:GNAT family N-acetyltransferase n=1 Tax=Pseudonocardia sp. TRM90224 TaxID=2812678 RepID=UPI001E3D6CE3|nr:GNAT family protein [Pseudonocardia sp. TRM90224]
MISTAFIGSDPTAAVELFEEPDFYFRTPVPDLLSEPEIRALLAPDAVLCRSGGRPVGLIWLPLAQDHGYAGHRVLHARFARRVPADAAAGTVGSVLCTLAGRRPVHRVTHTVYGGDRRGVALAEAAGFELEGALPVLVAVGGAWHDLRLYAKVAAGA